MLTASATYGCSLRHLRLQARLCCLGWAALSANRSAARRRRGEGSSGRGEGSSGRGEGSSGRGHGFEGVSSRELWAVTLALALTLTLALP